MELSLKTIITSVVGFIVAVGLVFGVIVFSERISHDEIGIKISVNGKAKIMKQGMNIVGLGDKVIVLPSTTRVVSTDFVVPTSDGKTTPLPIKYEYSIDEEKVIQIIQEIGVKDIDSLEEKFLNSRAEISIKSITEQYTILDLVEAPSTPQGKAKEAFIKNVSEDGFLIKAVTFGVPELDGKTKEAIDAQTSAKQANKTKELEIENSKLDAENKRIVAEGEAEKKRIESEASAKSKLIDAEATEIANKKIRDSITPELLQKQTIEKWNGELSKVQGEGSSAIINMPEAKAEEKK